MRDSSRLTLLLLVFGVTTALAQMPRKDEPYCSQHTQDRVEVADTHATILGLEIGHASLKDVQAKLGNAEIVRVSSEEESDVALCYVSPADGTVLVFYSGAMGGWKDITRFALWSRNSAFPQKSRCARSTRLSRNLSTESGLRLDLTEEQLKGIAGMPTGRERSSVRYEYVCRQKMTDEEIKGFKTTNNWDVTSDPYFDRTSWIEVHFRNSMGSRLEVGKIDSY